MIFEAKMSNEEFLLLREEIYKYAGIDFQESQKRMLQSKMLKRLRIHQLNSFKEYYLLLKYDPARHDEIKALMNDITVNETYFFREKEQLDVFSKEILPIIKQKNAARKQIKIWSAACSSGEEVYTLSMCLLESRLFDSSWKIEIVGTDISGKALAKAQEGIYGGFSFRGMDSYLQNKYFTKLPNQMHQIKPEVKKITTFSWMNLKDSFQFRMMRNFDIIFCRNVLIYFDKAAKKNVAENLFASLNPGGFLFISQTESLFRITNLFQLKMSAGALIYQKN